jgi:NADPH:quinone reductase
VKAAWYSRNGAARDVLAVDQIDLGEPGPGDVLVRLHSSGVNPSDVKSRAGRPLAFDRIIPHSDGAGIVEQIGEGVDPSMAGARVWVWNGQWKRPFGTAAEAIVLPASQVVRLPERLSFEAGACLGIPAMTAVHAVNLIGQDLSGTSVVITGAGSAVGHYAAQIAHLRGARVIGTASAQKAEHAAAAGCDAVIDYRNEDVAARVKDLTDGQGTDAIIDMDLSSTAALLPGGILRAHGMHVCYGSNKAADIPVSFPALLWNSLTLKVFVCYELRAHERAAALSSLQVLLDSDRLQHAIGARYALDEVAQAHEAVESGAVIGNVVLDCR